MELIINKDCFNSAISDVSKAVSTRTPFQILTGIKITADQNGLTLVGSNSDIVIAKYISLCVDGEQVLKVIKSGSIVVSSKYLNEIVKKLPGDIHLKVKEKNVVNITSNDIEINLNGFHSEEYPSLPSINEENKITMENEELMEVIQQTAFAVSKSESSPVLTGVNMVFTQNQLMCVATNSHRLALRKLPIESNADRSITVPGLSLLELTKLIGNQTGMINIFITENYIMFRSSTFSLYSRLIAGNYPNISGLIPKDSKTTLIVSTKQLINGLDRACLFANDWKNNNVHFTMEEDFKIKLSSNSSEIGNIEETIMMKKYAGEAELSLSFNGSFMMDALKTIKEEDVKISFGGSMKPIIVEPVNHSSQLHLISPVRSR